MLSYFSMLKAEFKGYNSAKLLKDVMAGLTVTAVSLPLALAFGVSSGANAAAGLITAIIAGLVISVLSGGFYQISGPTGTMAAVLISVAARYGLTGVFIVTFLAGIIRILAGVLRLGRLTSFIPSPVITGFTSGIALIIALGQVDNLFGVHSAGDGIASKLVSYTRLGFSPDWAALGVGLFVILFMVFYPKKWNAVLPSSLAGIIVATVLSVLLPLGVPVVGEIPSTLLLENRLHLSDLRLDTIRELLIPSVSVALLGMIETLLCGASAGRMTGVPLQSNQELIAQGIGNVLVAFFGGVPATAALARSSVGIKSGAVTRMTGIFHALGLMVSMLVLSPVMSRIPLSALAGVLVVTAWRMNDWTSIRYYFSHRMRGPETKYLVTMAATVVFDLSIAIVIGIVVGLVQFIMRSMDLRIAVEPIDWERMQCGDLHSESGVVVYVTGPMFFMTAETIRRSLEEVAGNDLVIFSMRGVTVADITAVSTLMEFCTAQAAQGKRVVFSSVQPAVMTALGRAGLVEQAGEDAFYFSVDKALKALSATA